MAQWRQCLRSVTMLGCVGLTTRLCHRGDQLFYRRSQPVDRSRQIQQSGDKPSQSIAEGELVAPSLTVAIEVSSENTAPPNATPSPSW